MRALQHLLTSIPLLVWAAGASCKSSPPGTVGPGPQEDAGTPPDVAVTPDGGGGDVESPDVFRGCQRDKDCAAGLVCNVFTRMCGRGHACTGDMDCVGCGTIVGQRLDCGHGGHFWSYCDTTRQTAGVCARSLAPCEPCASNAECGPVSPEGGIPYGPSKCLDYSNGKFCGRDCPDGRCPAGFTCEGDTQCHARACDPETLFCPKETRPSPPCIGRDQICQGEACAGGGPSSRCTNSDVPGSVGVCLGACTSNAQCPSDAPICNPRNGLCVSGCSKGACSSQKRCQVDGQCSDPCTTDAECVQRYGALMVCNLSGRAGYKNYRDDNSCAPAGCEKKDDCPSSGSFCDKRQTPPACRAGCLEDMDCQSGFGCQKPPGAGAMDPGMCTRLGCHVRGRQISCSLNQYCCGEPGTPYTDPTSCPTLTSTTTQRAQLGDCFNAPNPPWCQPCREGSECSVGGLTSDANQCEPIANCPCNTSPQCDANCRCDPDCQNALLYCAPSCDPTNNQCPRGWDCQGRYFGCNGQRPCAGNALCYIPMGAQAGICECMADPDCSEYTTTCLPPNTMIMNKRLCGVQRGMQQLLTACNGSNDCNGLPCIQVAGVMGKVCDCGTRTTGCPVARCGVPDRQQMMKKFCTLGYNCGPKPFCAPP